MTAEEWYALDKRPGMKFRTSDNKIGKLVSVHKDGATLDFTNVDGYSHVVRGFYRCVQLSDPDDPVAAEAHKPKKRLVRKVMRVKTGVIYETPTAAARALHISIKTIQDSAGLGRPIEKGGHAGESFRFVY